jgi:RNA polymerase sigma factor (TIGR02999 family)
MAHDAPTISQLLHELSQGKPDALDRLIPVVYDELRGLAHGLLRGERTGHTLNTTALVHETYLRLVRIEQIDWRDRAHFFAVSARVMRRVLIDYARARKREKRGGDPIQVPLSEGMDLVVQQPEDLLALEEALARLEVLNQRQCRVVECRCFAGMTVEETAAALDTSPATVKRDWAFARAWLNRELGQSPTGQLGADESGGL